MNSSRHSEAVQGLASDQSRLSPSGLSLQSATLLFVASHGSLIGAALLLASF
jgi:hypothetical protein